MKTSKVPLKFWNIIPVQLILLLTFYFILNLVTTLYTTIIFINNELHNYNQWLKSIPDLNYKDNDEKFILLGKVFETIEKKNSKEILSRIGIKNRDFGIICIKIFFHGRCCIPAGIVLFCTLKIIFLKND